MESGGVQEVVQGRIVRWKVEELGEAPWECGHPLLLQPWNDWFRHAHVRSFHGRQSCFRHVPWPNRLHRTGTDSGSRQTCDTIHPT